MEYVDLEWGERGEGLAGAGRARSGVRERSLDRFRFAMATLGALVGGGGAFALVHSTMSWVPDPGPMLPFTTFAGAVLGLFSAAYASASLAGRADEAVRGESEPGPAQEPNESPSTDIPSGELSDDDGLPPWILEVQRLRGPQGRVAL